MCLQCGASHLECLLLLIVAACYEVSGPPALAACCLLNCHNPSRNLRSAPMICRPLVEHSPVQNPGLKNVAGQPLADYRIWE